MRIIPKRKPQVINQATISIKHPYELDFIRESFEEIITDENNCIKIDFINGKSFLEEKYNRTNERVDNLFVEFFDVIEDDIITYFLDENSDYRVTDSEGTIVRTSKEDYNYVVRHKEKTKQYEV